MESDGKRVDIAGDHVQLRRNGVEFWSPTPVELWTEMTVDLGCPGGSWQRRGSGVVVSCEGNRHCGFTVSVLFLDGIPGDDRAPKSINPVLWS